MRLALVLCLIAITSAKVKVKKNEEPTCKGVNVREKFHRSEILAKGLNRPYQLSYYKHKREIYFSYNIGSNDEDKFEIGHLEENSTEHKTITAVKDGFATTIDEGSKIAFLGGSDGVYKKHLDSDKHEVTHIIKGFNIWDLYFKQHLYFITYPSQQLYKYEYTNSSKPNSKRSNKPEHQKWIHEKIYQFAIDGDNDIFITNATGLYMINKATKHRHFMHGATVFRAIEINNEGIAHFCGENAIYVPIKHNHTLHKIAHINNIFGLTFDHNDNIIFSDPHEIVKLLPLGC